MDIAIIIRASEPLTFYTGAETMTSTFPYKKSGLPYTLIKTHDSLLKDFIKHYEKDKHVRSEIKQAHKAVKQALKIAKKKKINPGIKLGEAREVLEALRQEMEYTNRALSAITNNLQDALTKIQVERIEEPLATLNEARDFFRDKEIEKGIEVLKESEGEIKKKVLVKSRTALFGGTSNEVTELKDQFEAHKKNKGKGKRKDIKPISHHSQVPA